MTDTNRISLSEFITPTRLIIQTTFAHGYVPIYWPHNKSQGNFINPRLNRSHNKIIKSNYHSIDLPILIWKIVQDENLCHFNSIMLWDHVDLL